MLFSLNVLVVLVLVTNVYSANILCFFPFPLMSHQNVFRQIWKALSERGHRVVVITPDPLLDAKLVNLTEIDVSSSYDITQTTPLTALMAEKNTLIGQLNVGFALGFSIVEHQLSNPKVQELLKHEETKFDVIIIENWFPMLYALGHKYNAPVVGVLSLAPILQNSLSIGNPTHPVLNPDFQLSYKTKLTFAERFHSTYHQIIMTLNHYYHVLPQAQSIAEKYFESVPDLYELERNISLIISCTNLIINGVRPNVPAAIDISLVHLNKPKELTQELKQIVEGSKNGIIYFSLGSNVKSVNIDERLKRVIVDALTELPYTVIWKWEADHMPGRPDNVIIKKWLPQQDLLAHPKVKAFVTQGGLQSAEEAIANGVPMVGLPFFGDQPMNVVKLAEAGVAIHLDKDTVTKEELKNAILEVARNPKYREKVAEVRNILLDQPMKSIDKAIWWIEYVIRHKGARHLRSPSLDLPLYQYFLLDVIGATLLVAFIVIYVAYRIIRAVLSLMFKSKKVKRS